MSTTRSCILEVWYVGCILPSSATTVTNAELLQEIGAFSQELGSVGGKATGEFDKEKGDAIEVVLTQTGQVVTSAMSFAYKVGKIVRNHGDSPDDLYITLDAQPGSPTPGKGKVFPANANSHPMKAGDHLLFTGAAGKERITATLGEHDGLVFWDRDGASADDFLFNLDNSQDFRTDVVKLPTGAATHVAQDATNAPIIGKDGLEIQGACKCPPGLFGKMFNDDLIFNAKEDAFYRVIWTLTPTA